MKSLARRRQKSCGIGLNLSILQSTGAGSIWQKYRNNKEAKVDWQFTADDARIKLKRLYPTIGDMTLGACPSNILAALLHRHRSELFL